MSAKVVGTTPNGDGGKTYDVEAGAVALSIEFSRGDEANGEEPWQADISFVVAERTLAGEGVNRQAAFLAAASRHETAVTSGVPLPAVSWADVERALEEAKAF